MGTLRPDRPLFLAILWSILLAAAAYPLALRTREAGYGGAVVFLLTSAAVPLVTGAFFRRGTAAAPLLACAVFAVAYAYFLAQGEAQFRAAHGGPPVDLRLRESLPISIGSAAVALLFSPLSLVARLIGRPRRAPDAPA